MPDATQAFIDAIMRDVHQAKCGALVGPACPGNGSPAQVESPSSGVLGGAFISDAKISIRFCRTRADLALFREGRASQRFRSSERVGRRLKALVYLEHSGTRILAGGLELASSIFFLRARDRYLGWSGLSKHERAAHLRQAADLSLFFCNPRLARLRGAKLIAMCALSAEVQEEFQHRYGEPLRVVTSIAAGGPHSAVLNRTRVRNFEFRKVGCTGPTSISHLSRETVTLARQLSAWSSDAFADPDVRTLNLVAHVLRNLGMPRREFIDIAPQRAVYVARVGSSESPRLH